MKNIAFLLLLISFFSCTIAEKEIFFEKTRPKIGYQNLKFIYSKNQTIIFSLDKVFTTSNPDSAATKCETVWRTDKLLIKTDLQGNIISEKVLGENVYIGYKVFADENGFWGMSGPSNTIFKFTSPSNRLFKADYDGKIISEQNFDFKKNLAKNEKVYFDTYFVDKDNAAFVFGTVTKNNKTLTNAGLFVAKIKDGKIESFNHFEKDNFENVSASIVSIIKNPDNTITTIWVKNIVNRSEKNLMIQRLGEGFELEQTFQFPVSFFQFNSIQLADNQVVVYDTEIKNKTKLVYIIDQNAKSVTEKKIEFDSESITLGGMQEVAGKLYLWTRKMNQTSEVFEISKDFKTSKTVIKSDNTIINNQFLTAENGIITLNGLSYFYGNNKTKSNIELYKNSSTIIGYKKNIYEFLPLLICSN